jgi:hypothetical protein
VAARQFVEEQQQPTRRPGDAADIRGWRLFGEPRHLLGPVGEAGDLGRRESERAGPAGQCRRRDAAEIAAFHPGRALDEGGAAAEQQITSGENPARRGMLQVVPEQIEPGLPVRADHLPGDRDEFGGAGAGARAGREERDTPRPADIDKAWEGWLPIRRPEILVAPQWHRRLKRLAVANPGKTVLPPEPGYGGAP